MHIACPSCRSSVTVPRGLPGQRVMCQNCLTEIVVPDPESETPAAQAPADQAPAGQAPVQQPPASPPVATSSPFDMLPGAPGYQPSGQPNAGTLPPVQMPPGQIPPGQMPPGQMPPGQGTVHNPQGMIVSRPGIDLENVLVKRFECPHCKSTQPPRVEERTSLAGWVTFALLLIVCFPLCWIGILIKNSFKVCNECHNKLGESW